MKLVPQAVTRLAGSAKLAAKANSPHILFGVGVVGIGAGVVLACRATLKMSDVLDEAHAELVEVRGEGSDMPSYNRDVAYVYGKNTLSVARLYAPSAILLIGGVACITGSHIQLTRRNAQLGAAYALLDRAYQNYRQRVADKYGEDAEQDLYLGVQKVSVADGDKKKKVKAVDPNATSPYGVFFDRKNVNWQENQEMNRIFLQAQQSYANHLLQSRGHVFLNEIYSNLGFDHTTAGAIVGWHLGTDGDQFIDFGIYDLCNADTVEFGENQDLYLDFNVDGPIYDLIG